MSLETGCFCDFNPTAEPQKGGPVDLWRAIFGVDDFVEVILGMEQWVKDGSLPDGTSGLKRSHSKSTKVYLATENVVSQDDFEKQKIRYIQGCQHWAEIYADRERRNDNSRWNSQTEPFDNTEMRKKCEGYARRALSEIFARRWLKAVAETQEQKGEAAVFLAEYRGLSPRVFSWLIEKGLIALYSSQRISTRTGGKWDDLEIAFPIVTPRLSPLSEEPIWLHDRDAWPGRDIEFLGMHLKWFGNGKSGWRYEPKGNGCGSVPFIIGDLPAARLLVIGESTWDVISFIDLYNLYELSPDQPWAAIDTGGASNAARIPVDQIKPEATILLLLQNDQNKANNRWCEALPFQIRERGRLITPPGEIKDLNDWMKVATREEVKTILEHE